MLRAEDMRNIRMHFHTVRTQRDAIKNIADDAGVELAMVESLEQWLTWSEDELQRIERQQNEEG